MSFRTRLKEARMMRNLTQEQLAHLIGVAKSTVAGYEKGISEPDIKKITRMMSALKVDANFLWQDEMGEGVKPAVTQSELELLEKYRTLDDHGRDMTDTVLTKEYSRCHAGAAKQDASGKTDQPPAQPVIREYPKQPKEEEAAVLRPVARGGRNKPIPLDGRLDLSQVKGIEQEGDDF